MEQRICKAKADGRCEGVGGHHCDPHSVGTGCYGKWCEISGTEVSDVACIPYAPEWICDHAGGCQVKKGKWCAFPFEGKTKFQGKRKFPGLGHTLLDALVWKRQPCEWTGFHVKAIPYKPKEDTVEKQYESLKPISIKALEEAGACERELHRFAYLAGMKGFDYTATIYIDDAVEIASKCKGGIQFLIDGGFIREKVLENPFKEVSVHQSHDGDWEIHVSNGSGHSWIMGTLTPHGLRMWNMYTDVFPVNDDGRIKIID